MKNPRGMGMILAFALGGACLAQDADPTLAQVSLLDGNTLPSKAEIDAEALATYGVNLYLARPVFDLRAMIPRNGQGGGLFMEEHLTPRSVLQTRIDYVAYRQVDFPVPTNLPLVPSGTTALITNAVAIGADYRMYLPYDFLKQFYLLAGMSAVRYEFRAMSTPTPTLDPNGIPLPATPVEVKDRTSVKWGFALGLGWTFHTGYSLTGRYTYVPISGTNLGALEFGVRASF